MSQIEFFTISRRRVVFRKFTKKDATVSYLTDSLTGILKSNEDFDQAKEERLREKYAVTD